MSLRQESLGNQKHILHADLNRVRTIIVRKRESLIFLGMFLGKPWLEPQYHENDNERIKKPNELEDEMQSPPNDIDREILDRIHGSMIGMALGDALGASVEFRPHAYMVENPVATLQGGGTWGLEAGQVSYTLIKCLI
jgi:hypothetical protein